MAVVPMQTDSAISPVAQSSSHPSTSRAVTTVNVRGTDFSIDGQYTVQKFVGCGSYGVVCSAQTADGQPCAIKKITNVFKNDTTLKRTLREIKLLLHFDHENVICIRDLMCGPNGCSDLYVVTTLMDTDLHKVIRSPQPLTDQHVQYFLYQLLRGLKYIHSCNVLHRDLKPSNLLVNENCDLKITDFGLSRGVNPSDCLDFLTEYVVTRWYRAPEIVLSSDTYTKAVDMWSAGCIFAELLGRKPLFPGSDHVQQLSCILDVLGSPDPAQMGHVPSKARRYIAGLPNSPGKPLQQLYPSASANALQLLSAMLAWEPSRRCTVEQALAHPYLAAFHNPAAEPVAQSLFEFDFEDLSEHGAREALFSEVCRFRPELSELGRLRDAPMGSSPMAQSKAKRCRQPLDPHSSRSGPAAAPAVPGAVANYPRYRAAQPSRQPLAPQQA